MSASSYTYVRCPDCQGYGVQLQQNNQSCPTCSGEGGWLQTADGIRLIYSIPHLVTSSSHDELKLKSRLAEAVAIVSFLALAASLILLVSHEGFSPTQLFWKVGPLHAVFALSGFASMWGFAVMQKQRTSERSLLNLEDELDTVPLNQPLLLNPFANERVEAAIRKSAITARTLGSQEIDDAIFLITILQEPRIAIMLARMERSAGELIEELKTFVHRKEKLTSRVFPVEPAVRDRIYAGIEEALKHDFPYIDVEDIVLGYLQSATAYAELFKKADITYEAFYAVTRWYAEDQNRSQMWKFWLEKGRTRPHGYMNRAWTALPTPYLDQYSVDITRQAANGNVATVTVRDKEINSILQVLGRTTKNSALLVGEPGVGKESILGALALRMIEENVPEVLKDKRLLSIDLGAMLTGGDSAEDNLQKALDEIASAGNIILAVPDIHVLVGTSDGALDAASIMAGAVSRGNVQLISTATYGDYHRYVESSSTLSALLEVVEIKEATVEQAITILEQEAPHIEGRQHVYLTYPAIEAAATLARRYFPDTVLPGSAINLLDEAASAAQLSKRHWVNKKDVEEAVERKTQVPVQQANDQESSVLLHLEDELHKRIVGQEEAVEAVSSALRRARAGLHDDKKPIANLLFVGPTGVGKTETAKAISDLYFGGQGQMVRIDMSEYEDATAVYKLIGAPASSSESYTEGGALTTPIREHPFSLILLDELEKAHPSVLNIFLQLLDDGRLTENTGRTVYYNNAIIIATSNAGSDEIAELLRSGATPEDLRTQTIQVLQKQFRPEFLNRFDAIVPFHQLKPDEISKIAGLMLQGVIAQAAKQKITISFTEEAVAKIGLLGYDKAYGARPLRRVIQDKVEGMLAKLILEHSLQAGQSLEITADMIQ